MPAEAYSVDTAGLGLYVHFPWCVRKCPYCDFNSHPLRGELDEAGYLDALLRDAASALSGVAKGTVRSVFCGGGTPSLFSPAAFETLLRQVAPWLAADAEITLEANPGTTEHHDFGAYRAAGINRLSLGAQSFDPAQLVRLGRIHGPDDTVRALRRAREAGFDNINLDVMYGLPEQSADAALADLERALALEPEHLSWYQLTIEAKTEFARRPPTLAAEPEIARMEAAGWELLERSGFARYEVSAYARPGRTCRHNVNYWRFGDYLGIGAGAHGKRGHWRDDGFELRRTRKASQPRLYLADPVHVHATAVAEHERGFEFLMNALRLVEGVDWQAFTPATGLPATVLEPAWTRLAGQGLLRTDRIATTARGYRYLDGVLQHFL